MGDSWHSLSKENDFKLAEVAHSTVEKTNGIVDSSIIFLYGLPYINLFNSRSNIRVCIFIEAVSSQSEMHNPFKRIILDHIG